MKTILRLTLVIIILLAGTAKCMTQQLYSKVLPDFEKIMISSHINATLIKSDKNTIVINHSNVEPEKLNILVKGNTLKLYVDKSRIWPKTEKIIENGHKKRRVQINRNVKVDVTIFFRNIQSFKFRGENGKLVCNSNLDGNKIRIVQYGENHIAFDSVSADKLKIRSFGENLLTINNGIFKKLKLQSFGENTIATSSCESNNIKSISIGESELRYNCNDKLKVISLGESKISWIGSGHLRKRFVLGETDFVYNK